MPRPIPLLLLFCTLLAYGLAPASAQRRRATTSIDRTAFIPIDAAALALGPMTDMRLRTIVDSLSAPYTALHGDTAELYRLRAIYRWITRYVALDGAGSRHPSRFNPSASIALQTRATNSQGFALLFQEACKLAHIQCTTVCGVAKRFPTSILNTEAAEEHCWNIVQLDDRRFFVDLAWSAGMANQKFEDFDTRYFDDGWFFTNKNLFYLSHWPNDKARQQESGVVTKQVFKRGPLVRGGAEVWDVFPYPGQQGRQRGKAGGCLRLVYEVRNPETVQTVYWGHKQNDVEVPAEAYVVGQLLYVDVPMKDAGSQQLWIRINDRVAYGYALEVSRGAKH